MAGITIVCDIAEDRQFAYCGNLHPRLSRLMDSGRIMQRTDGPTYTTTVVGAGQLWQGSNLTGGSSGGPWVVNFRSATPSLSVAPLRAFN